MEEPLRKQMIEHLAELRALLASSANRSPGLEASLLEHMTELEALIAAEKPDTSSAQTIADTLEQKLLSWEAEHPQLVAAARRIARALESAGL